VLLGVDVVVKQESGLWLVVLAGAALQELENLIPHFKLYYLA
jgi:hypothetical protein